MDPINENAKFSVAVKFGHWMSRQSLGRMEIFNDRIEFDVDLKKVIIKKENIKSIKTHIFFLNKISYLKDGVEEVILFGGILFSGLFSSKTPERVLREYGYPLV